MTDSVLRKARKRRRKRRKYSVLLWTIGTPRRRSQCHHLLSKPHHIWWTKGSTWKAFSEYQEINQPSKHFSPNSKKVRTLRGWLLMGVRRWSCWFQSLRYSDSGWALEEMVEWISRNNTIEFQQARVLHSIVWSRYYYKRENKKQLTLVRFVQEYHQVVRIHPKNANSSKRNTQIADQTVLQNRGKCQGQWNDFFEVNFLEKLH